MSEARTASSEYWIILRILKTGKCWRPGASSTMSEVRTASSSRDARARWKLQSVGAEAFGTHQVEDCPVVCFNPEWCFIPNYSLQFQKFLPCSLLYILAAHQLSRPALIFSLIHSPRENRTQIRLPESINTLQPEPLFTLCQYYYYTSVHCLRRNSDLKVGFPESINSSLLPRLCLT